MLRDEVRLECLKLAVSRATPVDVGKGCILTAKLYEEYITEGVKPRSRSKPKTDKLSPT